jgi:hypothetical protein
MQNDDDALIITRLNSHVTNYGYYIVGNKTTYFTPMGKIAHEKLLPETLFIPGPVSFNLHEAFYSDYEAKNW